MFKAVCGHNRIKAAALVLLAGLFVGSIAAGSLYAAPIKAETPTPVRFSLDRAIDGAAAPFILGNSRNIFRNDALAVTIEAATNSQDAIKRIANGDADIALADINTLIRYRDAEKAMPIKAVLIVYNKAPYAMVARKSRGIKTIADIDGKTIGLVEGDASARLWPAIAKQNGVKLNKVKAEKISAAVREPLLSAGQVDAVTGFANASAINLRDRGVPASDLAVLRFADFGSEVYGHALIVAPKFATEHPDAVKAFVRATLAGIRLAAKDSAKATDDVLAQMSGASRDIELERLRTTLNDNILTDEVKKNGIGFVEAARFERGLSQIAEDHEFRKKPSLTDILDDGFLPPPTARKAP